MITHRNLVPPSPDDDPTGVRALLSAMPEPDPMPDHLVERINASLAAAQAERAASPSATSVTPLVGRNRRRPGRVLLAIAGAAAAVALVAAVGDNLFGTIQSGDTSSTAAGALSAPESSGAGPQSAPDKSVADSASTPPLIQIRKSRTRYTQADFATQTQTLRGVAPYSGQRLAAPDSSGRAGVDITDGLRGCLRAIGAGDAQLVQAYFAFYDGAPAVIIVATTNGIPMAYAVGRECSLAGAAVLRSATPLP